MTMTRNCRQARNEFKLKVYAWAERLNVAPRQVRIQAMTRKWGSCSTLGYVSFADDLLLLCEEFQDFVIAHELLHLRIPNHSRLFKATLRAYLPLLPARPDDGEFSVVRGLD